MAQPKKSTSSIPPSNLASTVFQTGAKDSLAVVDVYSTTDTKVKTSLIDRASGITQNIVDSILSNPELLQQATSALFSTKQGIRFDQDSLLTALSSSSMGNSGRSMMGGLTESLSRGISIAYQAISGDSINTMGLMQKIGPVIENLSVDDLSSAQNITRYLANLTGELDVSELVNLDGEYAVLGAFINEAIRAGSAGAFETMLNAYDGKPEYEYVVQRVMQQSIQEAVFGGNLDIIEKLVIKLTPVAVLTQLPDIIRMILVYYHFPKKLKSTEYKDELTKLIDLLNLIDPNWYIYKRIVKKEVSGVLTDFPEDVKNIYVFAGMGHDALALFKSTAFYDVPTIDNPKPDPDLYSIELLVGPDWPGIDNLQNNQQKYPKLLIK